MQMEKALNIRRGAILEEGRHSYEVKARFGGGPTSKLINRSKGGHSVKYLDLRVYIGLTWIKLLSH